MIKMRHSVLLTAAYFAAVMILTAPAYLYGTLIRGYTSVSLANCEGTIWRGSATPVLHTGLTLSTLHWRVKPKSLLSGRLEVELIWDGTVNPMLLTLTKNDMVITNLRMQLPAEVLNDLSPYLKPVRLSGNLTLESPKLSYSGGQFQGAAVMSWREAGSVLSSVNPLGDYQVNILAEKTGLSATLSTLTGALLLNGQGSRAVDKPFQFSGTASATESAQTSLNELLHYLGPEASPGVYQISL